MKYYCPSCKIENLPKGNGYCVCSDVELVEMDESKQSIQINSIVIISLDLAYELLDNTNELIAELEPMAGYKRYDNRIAHQKKIVEDLNNAIINNLK